MRGFSLRVLDGLYRTLCSLQLAVLVIVGMTVAMIVATSLESLYDTPTAQFYVYRSGWFIGLLGLLGLNILMVALSRLPWKKHHTAFLLAHAGILLLLVGSWITQKFGIDGSMRLVEGRSDRWVEINDPRLVISDGDQVRTFSVPWHPPDAAFSPIRIPEFGVEIDAFMSHADPIIEFLKAGPAETRSFPAAKVLVQGGPMRIRQSYWLWAGDPSTARIQAGPATLEIHSLLAQLAGLDAAMDGSGPQGPRLKLIPRGDQLFYEARNSEGKTQAGKVTVGQAFQPGWRGGVQLTVESFEPKAIANVRYENAKIQYGQMAPASAIRLRTLGAKPGTSLWLGMGERAGLAVNGRNVGIHYTNQRIGLPVELRLERFILEHYEGTRDPSKYASDVSVVRAPETGGERKVHISMNEPLQQDGMTFYQSSYEDGQPRPTVSILSVNRDPGRTLKYGGSLLLVAGSILLFVQKLRKNQRAAATASAVPARSV